MDVDDQATKLSSNSSDQRAALPCDRSPIAQPNSFRTYPDYSTRNQGSIPHPDSYDMDVPAPNSGIARGIDPDIPDPLLASSPLFAFDHRALPATRAIFRIDFFHALILQRSTLIHLEELQMFDWKPPRFHL